MPVRSERTVQRQVVRLVSTTSGTDLTIELQPGINRIGRQRSGNHIVLVSPQVSRFHADLDVSERGIQLRDLGSGNGTYVNGKRITARELRAGDLIAFSDKFTFRVLVDVELEPPGIQTMPSRQPSLLPLPQTTPPETAAALGGDVVPYSLRQRTDALRQSHPEIADSPLVEAVSQDPPMHVGSGGPLEIAPADGVGASGAQWPSPGRLHGQSSATSQAYPSVNARATTLPAPTTSDGASNGGTPTGEGAVGALGAIRRMRRSTPTAQMSLDAILASAAVENLSDANEERRQLAVLYQVSKRCMSVTSLPELDGLLINVLERLTAFDRGFITYQLPNGDWKLVMSPKGDRWERRVVRDLLLLAMKSSQPVLVSDSLADGRLGYPGQLAQGQLPVAEQAGTDQRLLLPLRTGDTAIGAIFLISRRAGTFTSDTADFLSLFADVAALAVANAGRLPAL